VGVGNGQVQFSCDLLIGEIQAHEIQAENPNPQRLVMICENRIGEVVKLLTTSVALVALAFRLVGVKTTFAHLGGITRRAFDALGPTQLADGRKTFGIVNQSLNIDHRSTSEQKGDTNDFSTLAVRSRTSLKSELSQIFL
jgi:hypothetical protein